MAGEMKSGDWGGRHPRCAELGAEELAIRGLLPHPVYDRALVLKIIFEEDREVFDLTVRRRIRQSPSSWSA